MAVQITMGVPEAFLSSPASGEGPIPEGWDLSANGNFQVYIGNHIKLGMYRVDSRVDKLGVAAG